MSRQSTAMRAKSEGAAGRKPGKSLILSISGLFLLLAFSGCSGKGSASDVTGPALSEGKGAITGLVIDDRYRPVPDALVLLTPVGLTANTDSEGQFRFTDIDPGAYVILTQAANHESAPRSVDVSAGQYTEIELEARRTFSEGSYLITTQYSVFISCAIDFVANGIVYDCTQDASGDSDRPGFYSDYTAHGKNATFLVTEMLANKKDRYEVQLRCESGGGGYYGVARIDSEYAKMTFQYGNLTPDSPVPPEYGQTKKWDNKCKQMHTILFSDSAGREELQGADPTGLICCGAGAHFGIKAKFVQSLFLGVPDSDVTKYCVLAPNGCA